MIMGSHWLLGYSNDEYVVRQAQSFYEGDFLFFLDNHKIRRGKCPIKDSNRLVMKKILFNEKVIVPNTIKIYTKHGIIECNEEQLLPIRIPRGLIEVMPRTKKARDVKVGDWLYHHVRFPDISTGNMADYKRGMLVGEFWLSYPRLKIGSAIQDMVENFFDWDAEPQKVLSNNIYNESEMFIKGFLDTIIQRFRLPVDMPCLKHTLFIQEQMAAYRPIRILCNLVGVRNYVFRENYKRYLVISNHRVDFYRGLFASQVIDIEHQNNKIMVNFVVEKHKKKTRSKRLNWDRITFLGEGFGFVV